MGKKDERQSPEGRWEEKGEEGALPVLYEELPTRASEKGGGVARTYGRKAGEGRALRGVCIAAAIFAVTFIFCESMRHRDPMQLAYGSFEQAAVALREDFGALLTKPFLRRSDGAEDGNAVTKPSTGTTYAEDPGKAGETTSAPLPTGTTAPGGGTKEPSGGLTREELYAFDASAVPDGMIPIAPMDLSLSTYGDAFHYNDTDYTLSLTDKDASLPAMAVLAEIAGAGGATASAREVTVLVYHTHATEGFSAPGALYYDPGDELARTEDPTKSVIAVGEALCRVLESRGIRTVHDTTLHDKTSYRDSYSRSAETIQKYLAEYPSIRLVIDVHRDSILTSAGQLVRPVTPVDGKAVAQVMCVVGSDAAGGTYGTWRDNLSLAAALRHRLNDRYESLGRPVYVKKSTYNQQYAPASLLLEIGASGNSLEEALRAAALVGEVLSDMISDAKVS